MFSVRIRCGSVRDDIDVVVRFSRRPRRVVSIVPSLTESIAVTRPEVLVGATDWCSRPANLDVTRVRGTKNPDVEQIVALHPDVVVANAEENRPADLQRLRDLSVPVWVTAPTTVPAALDSLGRMFDALGIDRPAWLHQAAEDWSGPAVAPTRHAVVPIWRRPWMALGRDTFAGDLMAKLGVANVLDAHHERYPRIRLDHLPPYDLVVLPDEPYRFSETDGPEAFPGVDHACVSGRHLTWYGPSLAEARGVLPEQLQTVRTDG
ncbi:MAG: helical backbone metal receptor [Nocardioidaceae bacterium]